MPPSLTPQQIAAMRGVQAGNRASSGLMQREIGTDEDLAALIGPWYKTGRLPGTAFVPNSMLKYVGGWRANPLIRSLLAMKGIQV